MRLVLGQSGEAQDEGMKRRVEEVEAHQLGVTLDVELDGLSAVSGLAEQTAQALGGS